MKKTLPHPDTLIIKALELVFQQNQTSGKALQTILHNYQVDAQEELVHAVRRIIRYRRLYANAVTQAALQSQIRTHPSPAESPVGPVDPARLLRVYRLEQNPAQVRNAEEKALVQKLEQLKQQRVMRESIPDWLDALGRQEWGADWDKVIAWQNTEAAIILRTNTLKTDRQTLLGYLSSREITGTPLTALPEAVHLEQFANIFALPAFKQGWFEVQDAGSQHVSRLLNPQPGMRVIDACAGHGGKTLHLAALMHNKGRIIALDTDGYKFLELTRRARRAGVSIIECRLIDSTKVIKRLKGQADRLLLDVPCSGSGVWRRNPEGKERLTRIELDRLLNIQAEILVSYSRLVKPGGRLVYAVCSLFPCEGEKQVRRFLSASSLAQPGFAQPGFAQAGSVQTGAVQAGFAQAGAVFKLLAEQRLSPEQDGCDGFYMALLERLS